MSNIIFCKKFKKKANALSYQPYPGSLGERIQKEICEEAWQAWQGQQTMLINEYRLNMLEEKAQTFLEQEMERFFFGEGSTAPAGYTPPTHEH